MGGVTCDVTKHSHHLGRHLEFYHELENPVKTVRIGNFLCFTSKITHK